MQEHLETARTRGANTVPAKLRNRQQARAYYNVLKDKLEAQIQNLDLLVSLATGIDDIIIQH
jgi:type I restriction enzyme, R subunit